MQTIFKKGAKIFDFVITAVAGMFSVGVMLYGVGHFGLKEAWPELVLNMFYIACLVMIWMYFFNYRITTPQFNYWCSLSMGGDGTATRHPLSTATGVLLSPLDMSVALGVAALYADLFLFAQEMAELHQAQPMGYLLD